MHPVNSRAHVENVLFNGKHPQFSPRLHRAGHKRPEATSQPDSAVGREVHVPAAEAREGALWIFWGLWARQFEFSVSLRADPEWLRIRSERDASGGVQFGAGLVIEKGESDGERLPVRGPEWDPQSKAAAARAWRRRAGPAGHPTHSTPSSMARVNSRERRVNSREARSDCQKEVRAELADTGTLARWSELDSAQPAHTGSLSMWWDQNAAFEGRRPGQPLSELLGTSSRRQDSERNA